MPRARLHPLIVAALAAAALTYASGLARADEAVPRVGIVVTVQVNVTDNEATLLAERLGDALQDKLLVDVIAGREVTRRLADIQLPEDCVAQLACIADIGKRLDADQLIFLVIVRVGKQFQIDPTWADVGSGRTLAREAISLDESEPLPERVFRPRAQKLLPDAKPRQTPGTTVILGGEKPGGRHMTTATWIAGGIGAAALVGGTIFGLEALSTNGSLKDDGCDIHFCPDAGTRADRLDTQMTYADVLFGTAVVAGAAAAWFYWSSATPPPPPGDTGGAATATPTVSAAAGPGSMFLNVTGRF